jgi:hypothetical protein
MRIRKILSLTAACAILAGCNTISDKRSELAIHYMASANMSAALLKKCPNSFAIRPHYHQAFQSATDLSKKMLGAEYPIQIDKSLAAMSKSDCRTMTYVFRETRGAFLFLQER